MTRGMLVTMAALFFSSSFACTCLYMGTFEEFVKEHPIVVRGTVKEHGEELATQPGYFKTMSVVVSESIKGSFPHSELQFIGDRGMSCLRYITLEDYPVGSEHLFILESEESTQPLMVCGEASVRIRGNSVEGYSLDDGSYSAYERNLDEFLELIR